MIFGIKDHDRVFFAFKGPGGLHDFFQKLTFLNKDIALAIPDKNVI